MKKILNSSIVLIFLLINSLSVNAQKFSVKSLEEYSQSYKDKHTIISKEIQNNSDLSFNEKLTLYSSEISKLKEEFRKKRISEYQSKTAALAKRHKCYGTHVRKSTDCGYKYIKAPNDDMYTQEDWIEVKGIDKNQLVIDTTSVAVKMKVNGKAKMEATIYAKFKYIPERIVAIVDQETTDLFSSMTNK